ncbi:MAG: hypothetical protein JWM82_1856 [Myxococcales bacterium]|nr:hypothetical protein [Myxococcales bacterium]
MDEREKKVIRSDWRRLGFYYDRDDLLKERRLVGSREGLLRFATLLRTYVADPRNAVKSEHEHYGPYMSLEVMTWPEAGMDDHAIQGPLEELERLADLVAGKLEDLQPGNEVRIKEEFAPSADYALVLELRDDGFDPASMDSG